MTTTNSDLKLIRPKCRFGLECASYHKFLTNREVGITCMGLHTENEDREIPLEKIECKYGSTCNKKEKCPLKHVRCTIPCKFDGKCKNGPSCPYVHKSPEVKIVKEEIVAPKKDTPLPVVDVVKKLHNTVGSRETLYLSDESVFQARDVINETLRKGGKVVVYGTDDVTRELLAEIH